MLKQMAGEMLLRDLQLCMQLKNDEHFRKAYLLPAFRMKTAMI